ncbi:hypothetical protein GQ457_17G027120 [Hibiscus cannabinus]
MSTASLQSVGAFSRPSSSFSSDPARILFRSACHIQVFALIRGVTTSHDGSKPQRNSSSFLSRAYDGEITHTFQPKKDGFKIAAAVYGSPLTPIEYRSFFESQSIIPEAEYIPDGLHSNGKWRNFDRSLFWLAVIGGSLILLHAFLFLILKYKKRDAEKQRSYGALIFPRFEIFLVILALPCISQASAALVAGRTPSGV